MWKAWSAVHQERRRTWYSLSVIRRGWKPWLYIIEKKLWGLYSTIFLIFVSRPCFCLLHVEASKVPCNSMESIITAFLSCPTTHNQWLEFVGCDIIEKSFKTVSSEFQGSEEFGLYQVAEKRCMSGEHKSLSVPVGEPLFPLGWLADYTPDYVSRDLICKLLFARIQRLKRPGSMPHVSPLTCLVGLLTFS